MLRFIILCSLFSVLVLSTSCQSDLKETGMMVKVSSNILDKYDQCLQKSLQLATENSKLKKQIRNLQAQLRKYKNKGLKKTQRKKQNITKGQKPSQQQLGNSSKSKQEKKTHNNSPSWNPQSSPF